MALRAMLGAARAAWPDVRIADREFTRHLVQRLFAGTSPAEGSSSICAADLFLACACASGDVAALHHLETEFFSRLPRALSRINPCPDFTEEVLQHLRLKLLMHDGDGGPRILEYSGRGPLGGWLRAAAVRTALNLRGSRWREQGLDSAIERDLVAGTADPERALLRNQLRAHLKAAFGEILASLSPEERNLLRLHLVEGLGIDRLSVIFQIHRSTAARRLQRLRELLLDRLRARLAEAAGLGVDEQDSALQVIRSGLDLSLSRWLS